MKKKSLYLIITIFSAFIISMTVNAALPEDNGIMPCWENMDDICLTLGFDDEVGEAGVTVGRIAGVTTRIEGTLEIYRKSGTCWIFVDSVSGESTRALGLSLNFDAVDGTTYKAVAEITAYGPNGSESETVTKTATA